MQDRQRLIFFIHWKILSQYLVTSLLSLADLDICISMIGRLMVLRTQSEAGFYLLGTHCWMNGGYMRGTVYTFGFRFRFGFKISVETRARLMIMKNLRG